MTSSCVPRPQNTGGRRSASAASPGSEPGVAYPLRLTANANRSGRSRIACSATAAPCEKPSRPIDGVGCDGVEPVDARWDAASVTCVGIAAVEPLDRVPGVPGRGERRA